ncbi:hypothetical protein VTJ04DRAFT_6399 [Mycothermus thermophilus]|uniref:uncharacterized protein n=1 Tax=Humicola insolens TaxID=85995 RepID=UPI00374446C3
MDVANANRGFSVGGARIGWLVRCGAAIECAGAAVSADLEADLHWAHPAVLAQGYIDGSFDSAGFAPFSHFARIADLAGFAAAAAAETSRSVAVAEIVAAGEEARKQPEHPLSAVAVTVAEGEEEARKQHEHLPSAAQAQQSNPQA